MQTTTHDLLRSDVPEQAAPPSPRRRSGLWALTGVGAGIAGQGMVFSSGSIDAVFDPEYAGDSEAILERLGDQVTQMLVFHGFAGVCAVLLVLFAAGLHRRLREGLGPVSAAPMVAFAGLFGTALIVVMGTALNTEFIYGIGKGQDVDASNAVLFNHWIGTVPWVWMLAGLTGITLFAVSRRKVLPRWIGVVGLVLGTLVLLIGLSPKQYLAGMIAPLMVLVVSLGLVVGDRAHRGRS